jgi:hypothetical protein
MWMLFWRICSRESFFRTMLMPGIHVQLSRWSFVLQGLLYSPRRDKAWRRGSCESTSPCIVLFPSFHPLTPYHRDTHGVGLRKPGIAFAIAGMEGTHLKRVTCSDCYHTLPPSATCYGSSLTSGHSLHGHIRMSVQVRRPRTSPPSSPKIIRPSPPSTTRRRTGKGGN